MHRKETLAGLIKHLLATKTCPATAGHGFRYIDRCAKKTARSDAGKAEKGMGEGGKSWAPAAHAKRSLAEEAAAEGRRSTTGRHLSVAFLFRGGK